MTKFKKRYVCASCGCITSKWSGQCFACGTWSSVTEEIFDVTTQKRKERLSEEYSNIVALLDDNVIDNIRITTTITELDRVLGGGLVASSITLIGGDPGIGKSTLLLQLSAKLALNNLGCLYVTGEESLEQIKLRGRRLGATNNLINILSTTNIDNVIDTIRSLNDKITIVIIDSIQTMVSSSLSACAGSVSQIRICTSQLIAFAKQNNIILLITCHVTKDGQLAGPKVLEHMVDTVVYFEGDHNHHFRIVRSVKNRFGAAGEIGVFEMTTQGLQEVHNPSAIFLLDRDKAVSGSTVFAGIEGSRALLLEIQALIAPSNMPTPRRSVVGWDLNRLSMILAVLNVRFGLNLSSHEVYLTVIGGIKISEPAADLAVAAALISAATNVTIPQNTVFFGEVGLAGEVRKVSRCDARINEACKMGFDQIICAKLPNTKSKFIRHISHLLELKSVII